VLGCTAYTDKPSTCVLSKWWLCFLEERLVFSLTALKRMLCMWSIITQYSFIHSFIHLVSRSLGLGRSVIQSFIHFLTQVIAILLTKIIITQETYFNAWYLVSRCEMDEKFLLIYTLLKLRWEEWLDLVTFRFVHEIIIGCDSNSLLLFIKNIPFLLPNLCYFILFFSWR